MNLLSAVFPCVLIVAAGSAATTAQAQATGPLANPNPATAPQTNPLGHDAAPTASGNMPVAPRAQAMPPTVHGSDSRAVFAQLDRAQRGFLQKSDVTSNQYLSRHFGACDTDNDGKLSRGEVDACLAHAAPQSN